ncbi:hypothetical protein GI582_25790 [Sulfitobacter sp. BDSS02]|nr:hypothetical protein [Sulfitobacter sp. BDSS02]
MRPFDYQRAENTAVARKANQAGATFLAGGTNLLDLMKLEIMAPEQIIDISRLELDRITNNGEGMHIGATVTNSDLAADLQIRKYYPALLHKRADGRGSPFPGRTYPTASVTGMPSAV